MTRIRFNSSDATKPTILVDVLVNEKPATFLLDTGASNTIVNTSRIHLEDYETIPGDKQDAAGFGGVKKESVTILKLKSFRIGDILVYDFPVAGIDLTELCNTLDITLDGVLGHNFLSKYKVIIDYPNSTVEFQKDN